MRISELKRMEVINICDGKRLGFVGDVEFDKCSGKIECLIVPGPGCFCGFLFYAAGVSTTKIFSIGTSRIVARATRLSTEGSVSPCCHL